MSDPLEVLIIGAGPVGLTFANEMARYGIGCRVVDKSKGTKEISKALILHVRTQEVLNAMGLIHEPQDVAVPMKRVEIIGYGKHLGHGSMEGINSPHRYPIILGQNVTEHILDEHLTRRGVRVEWETEATEVKPDSEGVSVRLRKGNGEEECVRAKYVLGADGTRSLTRQQAGIEFEGTPYAGQAFIQSDSKIRWPLPGGVSYLWFTEKGYMMVIEMPGGIVRTFISVPDPGPEVKGTTLEEVNRKLNEFSGVDAELYDPVWVALFRVNHRAAPVFRKGRVFIAGDAAHEHVPIGGQGMNTSIQDAFNLGWKLAYVLTGKARENLLDSYQAERHPVAESLLRGTDEAYTKLLAAGDVAKAAVRMFGPLLLSSRMVREKMRNTLEEIEINYRQGPLTEDQGGSGGIRAGERVLDAPVVKMPEKETVTLWDIMRGTKYTLLLFTGRKAVESVAEEMGDLGAEVAGRYPGAVQAYVVAGGYPVLPIKSRSTVLLDPMGHAHDQYGVEEESLYLIRPDWYVGWRGGPGAKAKLEAYLDRILIAGGG